MAKITLPYDLKDVPSGEDSEIIPKGLYLCEVVRATFMEAKRGEDGKDKAAQIAITFKVIEAEKPENAGYLGAQFQDYLQPFTDSVKWKMKQWADALYGRAVEGKVLDTDKWIGKKVAVRTMVDNYQGREKTKVDRYMAESKFRKPAVEDDADPMSAPSTSNGASKTTATAAPAADDEVAI